jgi:hypothetical protein
VQRRHGVEVTCDGDDKGIEIYAMSFQSRCAYTECAYLVIGKVQGS